jgi:CDP-diacylglycerol--glycerol-3-phosphate 3-phosphatidyltransferase
MLNNSDARGVIAPVVEPIARAFLRIGLSADAVTVLGTAITVTSALWLIPQERFLPALLIVTFFVAADVLDGTMARLSGTQGPYGAWLDATMDRVADVAVFGAIVMWAAWRSDALTTYLAWACLAGTVAIPYAKARAEAVGATANGGIAERAERLMVLGVGAILHMLGVSWGMTAALGILAVLVVITVVQRAVNVRSQLRPAGAAAAAPAGQAPEGPGGDADAAPGS